MIHYYTSITNNYVPKARILARSIKKHHPEAIFHLVLCDEPLPGFDLAAEPFDHLHRPADLDIPDLQSWLFKHDVVELCTAVKGPAMWKILNRPDADQVFYFDPDIVVYSDLAPLHAEMAQASVILTPHQLAPEERDDAVIDNEICSLKHGTYNLGFLGVRATDEGRAFTRWWRDRLLSYCYADIPNGLFTDQRWCDLAPALFAGVRIVRDSRYNVATWNLTHRHVELDRSGRLVVDGKPLVFFHFSGFDSGAQLVMLQKYAPPSSPLHALHDWYVREMNNEGQAELGQVPCAYSKFSDGKKIPRAVRQIYRKRPDLMAQFPDPFAVNGTSLRKHLLREFHSEEALERATESERQRAEDLQNTITWRVGKLITGPIERVMNRVPGLVHAIKGVQRRGR